MIMPTEFAELTAADVSGQNTFTLRRAGRGQTVSELLERVVPGMRLPTRDGDGNEILYQARVDRLGRHLHATERIGDVLEEQDRLTIQPDIQAG